MARAAIAAAATLAFAVHSDAAEIDLSKFRIAFAEEFDFIDVSPWGENGSRWIAHTPWNGDFGDARFADPAPDHPFTVKNGILRIEARRNAEGIWESGLLAGVNRDWEGFTRRYGYFEARMKLPPGDGVWPAFWLNSREGVELDVVEYYGHDDDQFASVWHIWADEDEGGHRSDAKWTAVEPGSLTDRFNTYGVLVEPFKVTFFYNREPIWQFEAPWDVNPSFFPLVNLALGSGWPIDETPDPSYLYVDYIRVYEPTD
ncbi:glycoside hydrolase family 16 protein [Oricola thermophila]|uniref:Glycoside hydrolase family 16 protein n=2 Tax=Oricola thermophila TaxID=2742145 RepID=A0A6N1VI30_9HYPH|nr:glycoside hydrolase family 16 protein [Oricola thermophila]